mmetsp:Transcript_58418/g.65330  ORF Transcript_58418/g.65330 Transcript_58418/m.65330 type:complete len:101 (-) Transcript_58418:13-315(-)
MRILLSGYSCRTLVLQVPALAPMSNIARGLQSGYAFFKLATIVLKESSPFPCPAKHGEIQSANIKNKIDKTSTSKADARIVILQSREYTKLGLKAEVIPF